LLDHGSVRSNEADLVDPDDLGGRGVLFEGHDEVVWHAMSEVTGLGDINGDGLSDIGLVLQTSEEPLVFSTHILFGAPDWPERTRIGPEIERTSGFWDEQ